MNITGGEKSCLNRDLNPGSLATVPTLLPLNYQDTQFRHRIFHHITCILVGECPGSQDTQCIEIQVYDRELYTERGTRDTIFRRLLYSFLLFISFLYVCSTVE